MSGYLDRLVARLAGEEGRSPAGGPSQPAAVPIQPVLPPVGRMGPLADPPELGAGVDDPFETPGEDARLLAPAAPIPLQPAPQEILPAGRQPSPGESQGRTFRMSLPAEPAHQPVLRHSTTAASPQLSIRRETRRPPEVRTAAADRLDRLTTFSAETSLHREPPVIQPEPTDRQPDPRQAELLSALQALRSLGSAIAGENAERAAEIKQPASAQPSTPAQVEPPRPQVRPRGAVLRAGALPGEPLRAPALEPPAPDRPLLPATLAPQPRLVIGNLVIEVMPAAPAASQPGQPRLVLIQPAPAPARPEPPSRLQFGLGQI